MFYAAGEASSIETGSALVQLHYQDRQLVTSWKKSLGVSLSSQLNPLINQMSTLSIGIRR